MLIKQESTTFQECGSQDLIANSALNKGKSAIPPLFSDPEVLSSTFDKAKLFSKSPNLDESGISFPVFPSRTNLKLFNISVTSKMVKKVIMNLDSSSSKESGPYCELWCF